MIPDDYHALYDRGVRIGSPEQGAKIAHAIADLMEAVSSVPASEDGAALTRVPDAEPNMAAQLLGPA